jgi:predicted DNA-binding transcriptional regulator AlpA
MTLLRFADLKERKIVLNHVTLKRWIDSEGFPPGMMLGPNTRVWRESDVEEWLANRPVENTSLRGFAKRRAK